MLTDSKKIVKTTSDEVRDSPSRDTFAPSTDADILELPTFTESSEVPRNVNSPETLPSTNKFESKTPAKEFQENEKAKSQTGVDLIVFSSSEISMCKSDTTAVWKAPEGTKSPETCSKRKQNPSDTKEPIQLADSSDPLSLVKSPFEPDKTFQTKDDVQVCVMSLSIYTIILCSSFAPTCSLRYGKVVRDTGAVKAFRSVTAYLYLYLIISFGMSVHSYFCMEQLCFYWTNFHEIYFCKYFSNICQEIQV
jgi:hypothetical protein